MKKMRNVMKRIFILQSFFLVRFLVFETWSILYFTLVIHSGLKERMKNGQKMLGRLILILNMDMAHSFQLFLP